MKHLLHRALILGAVVSAYLLGREVGADDTGLPPLRRIIPEPPSTLAEVEGTPFTRRVQKHIDGFCEVWTGQPPADPSDCRVPLHGRTKAGGEGPENGTGAQRGEL